MKVTKYECNQKKTWKSSESYDLQISITFAYKLTVSYATNDSDNSVMLIFLIALIFKITIPHKCLVMD